MQVVGFIKGKSAIRLARVYGERKRNFVGQHFWSRGFFVNTVGRDEEAIRAYIRNQEDQRLEQMNLWRRRLQAAPSSRAASATRLTALSGSHPKAPGFAGGYLLVGLIGASMRAASASRAWVLHHHTAPR